MNLRQDNDVIDHTGGVYVEIGTELSWLIWHGTIFDKD